MKSLYTAHVNVISGRDGSATSSDGHLNIKLGFPKALGGTGDASNPEQLFAAGYAACFASSIKAAAGNLKASVGNVTVDAEATLSMRDDGSFLVSHMKLTVQANGLGDSTEAVVAEARRICAYSNATRGNVDLEIVLA